MPIQLACLPSVAEKSPVMHSTESLCTCYTPEFMSGTEHAVDPVLLQLVVGRQQVVRNTNRRGDKVANYQSAEKLCRREEQPAVAE